MKRWPSKRQVKLPTGRSTAFSTAESTGEQAVTITASASFQGLIDVFSTTGLAAAYSVGRRLYGGYTGSLIRIRRSSDNAEQDIPYVDSTTAVLNTTAIQDFIGADNAFVTTVYDQSGNARNWTQATAALQPRIATTGVVLTMGANSRPAMQFTGSGSASAQNTRLDTSAFSLTGDEIAVFMARQKVSTPAFEVVLTKGNLFTVTAAWHLEEFTNSVAWRARVGSAPAAIELASMTATKDFIVCGVADLSANLRQLRAQTAAGPTTISSAASLSATTATWPNTVLRVGSDAANNNGATGKIGEVVIYNVAARASASSGIDNNMATFWGTT